MTALGLVNWVKVVLRCELHRHDSAICMRVESAVPGPIRCQPTPSAPFTGFDGCSCASGLSPADFRRLVVEAVREGWGRWVQEGAVIVQC